MLKISSGTFLNIIQLCTFELALKKNAVRLGTEHIFTIKSTVTQSIGGFDVSGELTHRSDRFDSKEQPI